MRSLHRPLVRWVFGCGLAVASGAASQEGTDTGKLYTVVDGAVDARTYNGFLRYHGSCNHCHGPDGMGSTFASSLIEQPLDLESFRRAVLGGQINGTFVMKAFADDPNVEPYVDDLYAYLQARADGALGRGRPRRLQP